jgi:hypothetical protein
VLFVQVGLGFSPNVAAEAQTHLSFAFNGKRETGNRTAASIALGGDPEHPCRKHKDPRGSLRVLKIQIDYYGKIIGKRYPMNIQKPVAIVPAISAFCQFPGFI